MTVYRLEVHKEGELVMDVMYAFEEGADISLALFVHDHWDSDLMGGRNSYVMSVKDMVSCFFDSMEEYSYSITPYEIQGEIPARAPVPQPDPFPGMEPVPLGDIEVSIIRCCLQMVAPATIRKYINQYSSHQHEDYTTDHVKEAQFALIKKME